MYLGSEVSEYKCDEGEGEEWRKLMICLPLCAYRECGGEGETAGVRKVHGGQRRFNYTRPAPGGSSVRIESMFPEMEILVVDLTENLSLMLHAIHSPFYWWILLKTIFYSGFENPYKESQNKETKVFS
jgi:hypothetical protein